jgi:hypothetical protein
MALVMAAEQFAKQMIVPQQFENFNAVNLVGIFFCVLLACNVAQFFVILWLLLAKVPAKVPAPGGRVPAPHTTPGGRVPAPHTTPAAPACTCSCAGSGRRWPTVYISPKGKRVHLTKECATITHSVAENTITELDVCTFCFNKFLKNPGMMNPIPGNGGSGC